MGELKNNPPPPPPPVAKFTTSNLGSREKDIESTSLPGRKKSYSQSLQVAQRQPVHAHSTVQSRGLGQSRDLGQSRAGARSEFDVSGGAIAPKSSHAMGVTKTLSPKLVTGRRRSIRETLKAATVAKMAESSGKEAAMGSYASKPHVSRVISELEGERDEHVSMVGAMRSELEDIRQVVSMFDRDGKTLSYETLKECLHGLLEDWEKREASLEKSLNHLEGQLEERGREVLASERGRCVHERSERCIASVETLERIEHISWTSERLDERTPGREQLAQSVLTRSTPPPSSLLAAHYSLTLASLAGRRWARR